MIEKRTNAENELILYTTIGGFLFGIAGGSLIDVSLIGSIEDPTLLLASPLVLGSLSAGGLYYASAKANNKQVANAAISYIGKPTMKARDGLISSAKGAVDDVNRGIQTQVDNTVADIQNIPKYIQQQIKKSIDDAGIAAKNKVENIKQDIATLLSIP